MDLPWLVTLVTLLAGVSKLVFDGRSGKASLLKLLTEQRDQALAREAAGVDEILALRHELDAAKHELEAIRIRLAHVESMLPFALDSLMTDIEASKHVLNAASEPWGLSTPEGGGRIVWVNDAFLAALGMTLEEVVKTPWSSMVHPEDLRRMKAAEGRGWVGTSARDGHHGRYRMFKDGQPVGWRMLVFFFSGYAGGVCRFLARDLGPVEEAAEV